MNDYNVFHNDADTYGTKQLLGQVSARTEEEALVIACDVFKTPINNLDVKQKPVNMMRYAADKELSRMIDSGEVQPGDCIY